MIRKARFELLVYCLFGIVLIAGLLFAHVGKSSLQEPRNINLIPKPTQDPFAYKIVKTTCSKKSDCLIFTEVNEKWFVCNKMKELALQLRKDFAGYKRVRILLFDNPGIAGEYVRGIRSPKDIDKDVRGVYEYNRDKLLEFIEFSPEKGGKFNEVRISLN